MHLTTRSDQKYIAPFDVYIIQKILIIKQDSIQHFNRFKIILWIQFFNLRLLYSPSLSFQNKKHI